MSLCTCCLQYRCNLAHATRQQHITFQYESTWCMQLCTNLLHSVWMQIGACNTAATYYLRFRCKYHLSVWMHLGACSNASLYCFQYGCNLVHITLQWCIAYSIDAKCCMQQCTNHSTLQCRCTRLHATLQQHVLPSVWMKLGHGSLEKYIAFSMDANTTFSMDYATWCMQQKQQYTIFSVDATWCATHMQL
jgi:hypothetical protein